MQQYQQQTFLFLRIFPLFFVEIYAFHDIFDQSLKYILKILNFSFLNILDHESKEKVSNKDICIVKYLLPKVVLLHYIDKLLKSKYMGKSLILYAYFIVQQYNDNLKYNYFLIDGCPFVDAFFYFDNFIINGLDVDI